MIKKFALLAVVFLFISIAGAQVERESSDFSYALKLYSQEFYDLSAQQFIKFYSTYPQSSKAAEARFYAGESYFHLKQFARARREYQSMALEFPKSARAAEGWLKVGECAQKTNDVDGAIKAYETVPLLYPKNSLAPKAMFMAGVLYLQQERYNQAKTVFGRLLERYSESSYYFPAMVKKALCHFESEEFQEAKQLLDNVLNGQPNDQTRIEAQLVLAKLAAAQGQTEQAQTNFAAVLKAAQNSQIKNSALLDLSASYIENSARNKARQILIQYLPAIKDSATALKVHLLLGDLYYLDNKFSLSGQEYEQVLHYHLPDSVRLLTGFKLALSQRRLHLNQKATETLNRFLQPDMRHNGPLYQIVRERYLDCLKEDGRLKEIISFVYAQLNREEKGNSNGKYTLIVYLSNALQQSGRWQELLHLLKPYRFSQIDFPQKDAVLFYLAQAYEHTDQYSESLSIYRQIISEFGASAYYAKAQESKDYLETFKIVNQDLAQKHQAALIGQMLNNAPKDMLKLELAKIYFNDLKDFAEAARQLLGAMQDSSKLQGDMHLYLGKTYLTLARQKGVSKGSIHDYLSAALKQFRSALSDSGGCSAPDEASWLFVKTTLGMDSVGIANEGKYISALLQKYPDSPLKEAWYRTMAMDMAFDSATVAKSLQYFQLLKDNFPESKYHPDYLYYLGKLLKSENEQQALVYFKQVAADYPYSPHAAAALWEVARYYETQKQFMAASTLYDKLLKTYYYSELAPDARQKIGQLYAQAGKYKIAVRYLTEQIPASFVTDLVLRYEFLPPNAAENIYFLAKAYDGLGKTALAMRKYRLFLQLAAGSSLGNQARFRLAQLYYEKGQLSIASEFFSAVSYADSLLYPAAQESIGRIYFDQGAYKKAVAVYKKVAALEKNSAKSAEISSSYIIALIRDGQLKESKRAIKSFKKKFPDHKNELAGFVVELGKYYRQKKNFDKAIQSFKEVKKKYKSSEYADDADYYLAITYITLNKVDGAFNILSKFFAHYPKSNQLTAALNTLGSLYYRGEKYDNAITMFKNALNYCHERKLRATIMGNLIKAYTFTGFWDAAQALSRKYVQEFSEAPDRLDKKIVIARAYINLNQFQEAVAYLKKIKLEADAEREPEIQFYIGDALMKAGEYENAIAEFVKIPLLSKQTKLQWEASAFYYAGQCYEKLGRTNDAVRMYREIVRRPGIDAVLKKEAKKRIKLIQ